MTTETVPQIVVEMSESSDAVEWKLHEWADRITAAHQRGMATLQTSLDTLHGHKFSDRCYHELKSRAETAEDELARLRVALIEARRWIGDGDMADGLHRSIWTTKYAAAVDLVDDALATQEGK